MGLSGKDKETLSEIIDALKEMTEGLEEAKGDYRAIDAIDIALSLLEQQLEEDIEYIIARDERPTQSDDVDDDDSDDEPDVEELIAAHATMADDESEVEIKEIEPASLENLDFKFLTVDAIPSPDELESWFNLDSPEEDNI